MVTKELVKPMQVYGPVDVDRGESPNIRLHLGRRDIAKIYKEPEVCYCWTKEVYGFKHILFQDTHEYRLRAHIH